MARISQEYWQKRLLHHQVLERLLDDYDVENDSVTAVSNGGDNVV